ncbi:MAG: TldD/PmbA family protein [Acidimicrobiia bacterium]
MNGDLLLEACQSILDLVGDRAEAEVTVSSGRSALTRFANSYIHQNVADIGHWARLRIVADGRTATVGTSRLSTGLADLVERAFQAAALRPVDPDWPGLAPPTPRPESPDGWDEQTAVAPPQTRAEVVEGFVEQGGDRTTAAGFCETGGYEVAFSNSAGQRLYGRSTRASVEGIHRVPGADGGARQVAGRVAELDGAATGLVAAGKALRSLDPIDVEPGDWEVVLEPSCVADIVKFVAGQGFNAKHHAEGQSFVRLGEAQLDTRITIVDDATDPRILAVPFDAEGTPSRRLELVRQGVCTALAYDRRTARAAGTESTGHGVPGGEAAGPVPHHLFLQAGPSSPDELIGSVERGLLVTDFWYTRILDPKTTVVTGLTRNGTFLIENGRITAAVRNLRFTQSYVEALSPGNVAGVGDDARLAGESHHHVPSLHLRRWHFSGGAKG